MDQFNFDTYPNTDFNKVNLDWMLEQFPELEARIRALETGGGGAAGDSIFRAVYGTTSFADIQTALSNNLLPYLEESGDYYTLLMVRPYNISFFRMSGALVYVAICNDVSGWSKYQAEYVTTQSPHFSGVPTAPTAPAGTNSAQLATTAFVKNAIDAIPQGGGEGLSEEAKQALLDCFEHVAWAGPDGQTYYDALHDALFPPAELLSISALFSQGSTRIYPDSSLDELRPMLTVTAHYDDDTSREVTTYSLSGTLTVGTSTVIVSYLSKTTSILVTVSEPVTLSSISAVYTQSGTVYETDSLDSLKADLVVTATYSDSSTAVIPAANYTLSGTLTSGTSVITVSYGGQTTTFEVNVSAAPASYIAVGNPSISNGILTVTEGNFIKTPEVFSPGTSSWKATCKYRFTSVPSGSYSDIFGSVNAENASVNGFLLEFTNVDRRTASLFSSSNGTSWNITTTGSGRLSALPTDAATAWVWIEIEFTGSAYVVRYSLDGSQYTEVLNYASSAAVYSGYAVAYGLRRNGALPGEIDLSECKIYVGGELWWKAI